MVNSYEPISKNALVKLAEDLRIIERVGDPTKINKLLAIKNLIGDGFSNGVMYIATVGNPDNPSSYKLLIKVKATNKVFKFDLFKNAICGPINNVPLILIPDAVILELQRNNRQWYKQFVKNTYF